MSARWETAVPVVYASRRPALSVVALAVEPPLVGQGVAVCLWGDRSSSSTSGWEKSVAGELLTGITSESRSV